MEEKIILIPGRLKNAAKGGHVTGAEDIYDDNLGKTLSQLNEEWEIIQQLATLSVDGENVGIATIEDMTSSSPESRAKIPTVSALQDGYYKLIHISENDYNELSTEEKENELNWYFIEEE